MRHTFSIILWLITDLAIFVASYMFAYFWRVGFILSTDFSFQKFLISTLIACVPWLVVLMTTRTFALGRNQSDLRNAANIAYASVVGNALFALVFYFLYGQFFSRLLLIQAFVLSTVTVFVWHIVYEKIQRMWLRKNPPAFPTLIVGVTRESTQLIETLIARKNPLTPVAFLDGTGAKDANIAGVPNEGKLNKLEDTIAKHKITHLIQCSDLEQSINLLSACRQRGITYMLLPSVLGIVEHDEKVELLEGRPVTMVSSGGNVLSRLFS